MKIKLLIGLLIVGIAITSCSSSKNKANVTDSTRLSNKVDSAGVSDTTRKQPDTTKHQ